MNTMDSTPKRNRSSSFSRDGAEGDIDGLRSPQTPSPPSSGTKQARSTSTVSFLLSPTVNRNSAIGGGGDGKNNGAVPQSPSMKPKILAPTTPKSRASEMFLSPSPTLRSPATQQIPKDSDKPIREISYNLKTRLNYAFMKLQNGWQDKTLPELETELEAAGSPRKRHGRSPISESHTIYQYSNKYAEPDTDDDESVDDAVENSAQTAFLKALSSPTKKPRSMSRNQNSPPGPPLLASASSSQKQPSEVEAIETLMSLSTSQKRQTRSLRDSNLNGNAPNTFLSTGIRSYNPAFSAPSKNLFTTPLAYAPAVHRSSLSSESSDSSESSLKKALVKPFGVNPKDNEQQRQIPLQQPPAHLQQYQNQLQETQSRDQHQHQQLLQQQLQQLQQLQHSQHSEVQTDVETDVEETLSGASSDDNNDNDK